MNMKNIYANPYKYAVKCNIPFELAKIMCKKQRHFRKEERKHRMYCPKCGSKELIFEGGSYEEGYGDFIECDSCGETFDCSEVPNSEYANLTGFEDFDPVLFFAGDKAGACGDAVTHEEWVSFARKMITGKEMKTYKCLSDCVFPCLNEYEEDSGRKYSVLKGSLWECEHDYAGYSNERLYLKDGNSDVDYIDVSREGLEQFFVRVS